MAWFTRVRPRGNWVRRRSLSSLGCDLGVVGSFVVDWFIGVRPGACRVHEGSMGSLVCALGVVRFIRGRSGSLGCALGSLGLSRVTGLYGVHSGD